MGYFNYFIKCFIRLFTRKYFKFILIFIVSFLLFFIFNNNFVRAEASPYVLSTSFFSEADINQARSKVGETIWNNEDYDIFIGWYSGNYQKYVGYCNVKNYYDLFSNENIYYKPGYSLNVSGYSLWEFDLFHNGTPNGWTTEYPSDFHIFSLYGGNIAGTSGFVNNTGYGLRARIVNSNEFTYYPVRSHFPIYDMNDLLITEGSTSFFTKPYFITTNEELSTFDFDYLQINGGSTKYITTFLGQEYKAQLTLKYIYNGVTTSIEILDDYISYNSSNNTWQINIPYNALTNSVVVRNGNTFRFVLDYRLQNETGYSISTDDLTYNLTTEQEENINAESNKQLQDAILNTGQQTNNNLNNINNNLTNSNVDNITQNSLPQDTTSDITSDGVNGIFQSIYNAFCVGQPQDIIFPFPFTEKNITLSPSYVRNALEGSGAGFIILIIQAFWWYLISRFIIKDIMGKINNIKSGNIENIEKTNIRGDML